jgi:hypothetical protein
MRRQIAGQTKFWRSLAIAFLFSLSFFIVPCVSFRFVIEVRLQP